MLIKMLIQQDGYHVLHLKLWGESMKMYCPLAPPPPSVSCFKNGMVLNMDTIEAEAFNVKGKFKAVDVDGSWIQALQSKELNNPFV